MKNTRKLFVVILLLGIILNINCKKNDNSTDTNPHGLTEEEWNDIFKTDSLISLSADSILLLSNPMQGWNQMLGTYKSYINVESAYVTNNSLVIKFKKGGFKIWNKATAIDSTKTYSGKHRSLMNNQNQVSNTVRLVNVWHNDLRAIYLIGFLEGLKITLQSSGFNNVEIVNTDQADINFFKTSLKGDKLIDVICHGFNLGSDIYLQTGELFNRVLLRTETYYDDWINGRIILFPQEELRLNGWVVINYLGITQKFYDNYYSSGDFPNSFFYTNACEAFMAQDKTHFADILNSKGIGVAVGYDEENCRGPKAGIDLIRSMCSGLDLNSAYNLLQENQKHDNCTGVMANLIWFPSSAGSYRFFPTPLLPSIITTNITNITETTATGGGEIMTQGNSSVTSRGVCWSTSTNPTLSDPHTTDGIGMGTFVSNITGLTEDTRYFVRAYATNNEGTAYGNEVTFFTSGNLSQGLVAYYPFNGNANDESGNGHNGIAYSTSNISDRFGNPITAFYYNGDAIVWVPNNSQMNFDTHDLFTISTWLKIDSIQKYHSLPDNYIIGKWSGWLWTGYPYALRSLNQSDINVNGKVGIGRWDGSQGPYVRSSTKLNDGKWHHVVFLKDNSNILLYIDGVLEGTTLDNTQNSTSNSENIFIGGSGTAGYSGGLDDTRFYNRALSYDEILELFHEGGWK